MNDKRKNGDQSELVSIENIIENLVHEYEQDVDLNTRELITDIISDNQIEIEIVKSKHETHLVQITLFQKCETRSKCLF